MHMLARVRASVSDLQSRVTAHADAICAHMLDGALRLVRGTCVWCIIVSPPSSSQELNKATGILTSVAYTIL